MDIKEKLVELLGRVQQMGVIYKENQMDERYPTIEQIRNTEVAARLIANGVTVQEWISVKDGLPESGKEGVLIALLWGGVDIGWCEDGRWRSEFVNEYEDGEVTHWMPLPNQPEGE